MRQAEAGGFSAEDAAIYDGWDILLFSLFAADYVVRNFTPEWAAFIGNLLQAAGEQIETLAAAQALSASFYPPRRGDQGENL